MWKPIDTAPKNFDDYRILVTDGNYLVNAYWDEVEVEWVRESQWGDGLISPQPTHWTLVDDVLEAFPIQSPPPPPPLPSVPFPR